MKKLALPVFVAISALVLSGSSAFGAEGKPVSYKSGDETVQGVLYTPAGKGPFPALIVIHEWWGLNDWIKDQGSKLADQGYESLAVDLYRGKVATTPDMAHELMRGVPEDRAKRDLHAAFEFLQSQPSVKKDRIGASGWCMGGEQSLLLSLADPRVKATAIFYGPLVTDPDRLKSLQGPVLGIFGNDDKGPSPTDVEKFRQGLSAAGKTDVTIYQYDGVGHAFASPSADKLGLYNPDKAQEAWAKCWQWLDDKLLIKK